MSAASQYRLLRLTDRAGALGAVLTHAAGRGAPGGDGARQGGDHEDQGEQGDTLDHYAACATS